LNPILKDSATYATESFNIGLLRSYAATLLSWWDGLANLVAANTIYTADRPTRTYTIRESKLPSPKMLSTRLKSKAPTRPQFNPPTIISTSANQSIALNFITSS
jgi:hypothetical protein